MIDIKSTPTSRWAFRYRRRYGYTFPGGLIFAGVIALLFGGTGIAIGIAFILVGGYMMHRHHTFHQNLRGKSGKNKRNRRNS